MLPVVYPCRVCTKRIPKKRAALALLRGKVPTYCSNTCGLTGRSREKRAKKKAAKAAAVDA